jgi:hypothetical protein
MSSIDVATAMNKVSKIDKRDAGDQMMLSYSEMRDCLNRHYERTGDLLLKDVVDRADAALRMLRGVIATNK